MFGATPRTSFGRLLVVAVCLWPRSVEAGEVCTCYVTNDDLGDSCMDSQNGISYSCSSNWDGAQARTNCNGSPSCSGAYLGSADHEGVLCRDTGNDPGWPDYCDPVFDEEPWPPYD